MHSRLSLPATARLSGLIMGQLLTHITCAGLSRQAKLAAEPAQRERRLVIERKEEMRVVRSVIRQLRPLPPPAPPLHMRERALAPEIAMGVGDAEEEALLFQVDETSGEA
mmetsp:Transcript_22878/g.58090  ORF Transcript_22878/g.58090 Transcript_22878/m.58090 type:complete len:110 (-) Transcript_22878:2647-2976(-)